MIFGTAVKQDDIEPARSGFVRFFDEAHQVKLCEVSLAHMLIVLVIVLLILIVRRLGRPEKP